MVRVSSIASDKTAFYKDAITFFTTNRFLSGHSLKKADITSAVASNQVVEWYLPQIDGVDFEGSVPCWSNTHHCKALITAKTVCLNQSSCLLLALFTRMLNCFS